MSKSFPTPSKTFFILFFSICFFPWFLDLRVNWNSVYSMKSSFMVHLPILWLDPNGTMIQVISRHLQYSSFYTFFPYIPFKTSVTMGFLPLKQSNGVQPYLPFFFMGTLIQFHKTAPSPRVLSRHLLWRIMADGKRSVIRDWIWNRKWRACPVGWSHIGSFPDKSRRSTVLPEGTAIISLGTFLTWNLCHQYTRNQPFEENAESRTGSKAIHHFDSNGFTRSEYEVYPSPHKNLLPSKHNHFSPDLPESLRTV